MALKGVPKEVRRVKPDNTSEYMRPMPGAARMYPETDVHPIRITREFLEKIPLPELPEEKAERYTKEFGLSPQQANQLISEGEDATFEEIITSLSGKKEVISKLTASIILNTLPELRRDGVEIGTLGIAEIIDAVSEFLKGIYSREAIPEVLREMVKTGKSADKAASKLGLTSMSEEELKKIINRIVSERKDFIQSREMGSIGPLMGVVMENVRGRADGRLVNRFLREAIEKAVD